MPGVSLFAGYLGDAAATALGVHRRTAGSAPATAYAATPEGTLTFAERDTDMLKVAGENVGALEVERVILDVPGVREAAVVGRPDALRGELPVAFVLADGDADVLRTAIAAACEARLAAFKRPAEVRLVAELPRSTLAEGRKGRSCVRCCATSSAHQPRNRR